MASNAALVTAAPSPPRATQETRVPSSALMSAARGEAFEGQTIEGGGHVEARGLVLRDCTFEGGGETVLTGSSTASGCHFSANLGLDGDEASITDSAVADTLGLRMGARAEGVRARTLDLESGIAINCVADSITCTASDESWDNSLIDGGEFSFASLENVNVQGSPRIADVSVFSGARVDSLRADTIVVHENPTLRGLRPLRDVLAIDLSNCDPYGDDVEELITIDIDGVVVFGDPDVDSVGVSYPERTTVWIGQDEQAWETLTPRSLALRSEDSPTFVDARNTAAWGHILSATPDLGTGEPVNCPDEVVLLALALHPNP